MSMAGGMAVLERGEARAAGAGVVGAGALLRRDGGADSDAPAFERIDGGARDVLLAQEAALRFPDCFGSAEALALGCALARVAGAYDRGVAAAVTREADGLVLFSWAMDDKAPRHARFAEGKRAAAKLCGHASLMCYVEHELTGAWDELYQAARDGDASAGRGRAAKDAAASERAVPAICPVGGAFPIRVEDEWVATLAVSGLHDGLDHELCVRALASALDLSYGFDVPAYRYPAR